MKEVGHLIFGFHDIPFIGDMQGDSDIYLIW